MWFWIAAFALALAALLYVSYRFVEATRDNWKEDCWLIVHAWRELCAGIRSAIDDLRPAHSDEYELWAPQNTQQPVKVVPLFDQAEDPWPTAPIQTVGRHHAKHVGATEDWSPTGELMLITQHELTDTSLLPHRLVQSEIREPDPDALLADTKAAMGEGWSDEIQTILNRWQAAIDAPDTDYPAAYKRYKGEFETGVFDTSELQLLLDADSLVSA